VEEGMKVSMTFEWDDNKEQINIKKHGIDFETASHVFMMITE
jgi:Uncharacterized protein conserved in bacteria